LDAAEHGVINVLESVLFREHDGSR
jgi:hypothetical protein